MLMHTFKQLFGDLDAFTTTILPWKIAYLFICQRQDAILYVDYIKKVSVR